MKLTVQNNSVEQINAALLSLSKEIEKQNKQSVKVDVDIEAERPLEIKDGKISLDTRGVWEGTAKNAVNADITKTTDVDNGDKLQIGNGNSINITNSKHSKSSDSAEHAQESDYAKSADITYTYDEQGDRISIGDGNEISIQNAYKSQFAVEAYQADNAYRADEANSADSSSYTENANITKTTDTTNGDKLQIGINGTPVNITNAKHSASSDSATNATNANITKTTDTTNGDKLQIGSGTPVNITNSKHSASSDKATNADITKTADTTNGDKLQIGNGTSVNVTNSAHSKNSDNATNDKNGKDITTTYLPVAGGTMTGNIKYKSSKQTVDTIRFAEGDANGSMVSVGAGGLTLIGGGESNKTLENLFTNKYVEKMVIGADDAIEFYSNVQNGTTTKAQIDLNGTLSLSGALAQGYVNCTLDTTNKLIKVSLNCQKYMDGLSFIFYNATQTVFAGGPVKLQVDSQTALQVYYENANWNSTTANYTLPAGYFLCYKVGSNFRICRANTYTSDRAQTASFADNTNSSYRTTGFINTAAATADKVATLRSFNNTTGDYLIAWNNTNTAKSKLTLNANSQGAKDVYLNGVITSATNYNIPAGTHLCHYDSSKNAWFIKTQDFVQLFSGLTNSGTITLSAALTNFKGVIIEGALYTTNNVAEQVSSIYLPIEEVKTYRLNSDVAYILIGTLANNSRRIRFGFGTNLDTVIVNSTDGDSGHKGGIIKVWGVL